MSNFFKIRAPLVRAFSRRSIWVAAILAALSCGQAWAAPYAELVMDARNGQVYQAKNADARLHPASLTKMMTLYIAFEALENKEMGEDDTVVVSANAAKQIGSELGLQPGTTITIRHLLRATAIKSANDAATALAEAISGSEAGFVSRMNRMAGSMGLTNTHFANPHGLTAENHYSSAHDMARLGWHLYNDYPRYYNIFSRLSADAGVRTVTHTNRKFLTDYPGADGIKTGYTSASGFSLVGSAERGGKRMIGAIFGATSNEDRARKMARLLDEGFAKSDDRVRMALPARPGYSGNGARRNAAVGGAVLANLAMSGREIPMSEPGDEIVFQPLRLEDIAMEDEPFDPGFMNEGGYQPILPPAPGMNGMYADAFGPEDQGGWGEDRNGDRLVLGLPIFSEPLPESLAWERLKESRNEGGRKLASLVSPEQDPQTIGAQNFVVIEATSSGMARPAESSDRQIRTHRRFEPIKIPYPRKGLGAMRLAPPVPMDLLIAQAGATLEDLRKDRAAEVRVTASRSSAIAVSHTYNPLPSTDPAIEAPPGTQISVAGVPVPIQADRAGQLKSKSFFERTGSKAGGSIGHSTAPTQSPVTASQPGADERGTADDPFFLE